MHTSPAGLFPPFLARATARRPGNTTDCLTAKVYTMEFVRQCECNIRSDPSRRSTGSGHRASGPEKGLPRMAPFDSAGSRVPDQARSHTDLAGDFVRFSRTCRLACARFQRNVRVVPWGLQRQEIFADRAGPRTLCWSELVCRRRQAVSAHKLLPRVAEELGMGLPEAGRWNLPSTHARHRISATVLPAVRIGTWVRFRWPRSRHRRSSAVRGGLCERFRTRPR